MRFKSNAFMPFTVLGDPNFDESISIIKSMIKGGADALELGFAFSDPIADGPVIQRGNKRALDNGITTKKSFEIIEKIREDSDIPISIMLSYNIVFNYGLEEFYSKCKEFKIDAVLIPDVPPEESDEVMEVSKKFDINQVFIVSPVTPEDRMEKIKELCSGYVYLVSLLGTTGTREGLDIELEKLITRTKKIFDIPVYVGFGISTPDQAKKIINFGADGAIIGSALCKRIEDGKIDEIEGFCRLMKEGIE